MNFNLRIEDLEVRSCNNNLMPNGKHERAEIVKYSHDTDGKEFCWTVAYWIKEKEGYNLKFVGGRPFNVYGELFMKIAKQGQILLDEEFEKIG